MNFDPQNESWLTYETDFLLPERLTMPENFELQTALEELQLAQEELRQQNQELLVARQTAQEERQRYQELFNFAPDAYLVTDATGRIQEANYAAAVLLNTTQQLLVGEHLIGFIAIQERQTIENRLNWLCTKLSPIQEWEVLVCPREKEPFDASLRVGTFRYRERKAVSLRWLLRDISTQKKALEKEKEINKLKSLFISMASHEFRTPLTTILSSSDLLKCYGDKFTDEKKLQYFNKIQEQVKNMTQLLDDVLFISKTESGRLELNPAWLNLTAFCREVLEEIEMGIGQQHSFIFGCQEEKVLVEIDVKLMRQVLTNLLSNAVKYSPEGSNVYCNLLYENQQIILQIRDEGMGIPVAEQEHLFDFFYRASNVGNILGTGLGMAIVKQAVELQGGTITVDSVVDVGTTFTVCIPTSGN